MTANTQTRSQSAQTKGANRLYDTIDEKLQGLSAKKITGRDRNSVRLYILL